MCAIGDRSRPPLEEKVQASWEGSFGVAVLVFERRADLKEEPQSYAGFQQQYRRQYFPVTICPPNPAA
jgi:hypothetical protein